MAFHVGGTVATAREILSTGPFRISEPGTPAYDNEVSRALELVRKSSIEVGPVPEGADGARFDSPMANPLEVLGLHPVLALRMTPEELSLHYLCCVSHVYRDVLVNPATHGPGVPRLDQLQRAMLLLRDPDVLSRCARARLGHTKLSWLPTVHHGSFAAETGDLGVQWYLECVPALEFKSNVLHWTHTGVCTYDDYEQYVAALPRTAQKSWCSQKRRIPVYIGSWIKSPVMQPVEFRNAVFAVLGDSAGTVELSASTVNGFGQEIGDLVRSPMVRDRAARVEDLAEVIPADWIGLDARAWARLSMHELWRLCNARVEHAVMMLGVCHGHFISEETEQFLDLP